MSAPLLTADVLEIDPERVADEIARELRRIVNEEMHRKGVVVGLSGGVDSSVTAALGVRAFGREHVLGVLTPERESSPDTLGLSRAVAQNLGIDTAYEDITPILEATGAYRRRDEAIGALLPEYTPEWKVKLVLPSVLGFDGYRMFSLVAQPPDGQAATLRLHARAYLEIVAATNFKQRARKMIEYYHADRLAYAVAGTPNLLEYDQGFFVKNGDGAADVKPIAHLYKTQVYALARYLGLPDDVVARPPTTDTYSMPQSQEEFYFSLPYHQLDLCLYAHDNGYEPDAVADAVGLSAEDVGRVFRDIERKRTAAVYLHAHGTLVGRADA